VKAFNRVPREVVWWVVKKLGVEEWLIKGVMAIYRVGFYILKKLFFTLHRKKTVINCK